MEEADPEHWDSSLAIPSLHADYCEASITPSAVIHAVYERIEAYKVTQPSLWIYLQPLETAIQAAKSIEARWPDSDSRPPLWGVPFSVKDNIDIAGIPTTCGLPIFAYTPGVSAPVYEKCIEAGALFIGKTNMEQLATGLTGCRSAYGTLHSTWSKTHIVGGSSSGSAVSVGAGLVSFSLGTDTAGSIRVPALFNGIVGFKPTKGTISARGVVPACKHQDTLGFLALNAEDAETVWRVCQGFDRLDPFAKRDFFIKPSDTKRFNAKFSFPPADALADCSSEYLYAFKRVMRVLCDDQKSRTHADNLDWEPFSAANELLYNRSFVLERLTILPDGWFESNKQHFHPVTRQVFDAVLKRGITATEVFKDLHKEAELKSIVRDTLSFEEGKDENVLTAWVVPTAPFHPTIREVEASPIETNAALGSFSHFANVLDLVGIALPAGSYSTQGTVGVSVRLPFGVTVLAKAGLEAELLKLAKKLERDFQDMEDED